MLPNGIPFPVIPEATEIMNIIVPDMLQNALTEKMTVEEAADDAAAKVKTLARRACKPDPTDATAGGAAAAGRSSSRRRAGQRREHRYRDKPIFADVPARRAASASACLQRIVQPPRRLPLRAAGARGDADRHRLPDLLHDRALASSKRPPAFSCATRSSSASTTTSRSSRAPSFWKVTWQHLDLDGLLDPLRLPARPRRGAGAAPRVRRPRRAARACC